jgi:hypothetical protein
MRRETITSLVLMFGDAAVVVETPLRVLRAAEPMHQMTDLGFFIPEAPDAAAIAVFAPQSRIDVRLTIERGYKLVAMRR